MSKRVAIIDYGAGNLKNVETASREVGLDGFITRKSSELDEADAMILPGVGAFADAMESLENTGLIDSIYDNVNRGKILLGICLGMQMLFDESEEKKLTKGLGLIPGRVREIRREDIYPGSKIPHMGWNALELNHPEDPFLKDISPGDYVYFVHSYYADPEDFDKNVLAYADYKLKIPGVVREKNVIGTQFHPEKSSAVGFRMLKNLKSILENDHSSSN